MRSLSAIFALFLGSLPVQAQTPVNPHAALVEDFGKRVAEYRKLHQSIESKAPALKPTRSAAEIAEHEKALAQGLRAARVSAAQGDIFTPEISREFRRLIGIAMQGKDAVRIKKSLKSAEPVQAAFRINDPYPEKLPLQSTPPTLLLNLPELPAELDYRIVGHALILRDAKANMIVDFIPNILPGATIR